MNLGGVTQKLTTAYHPQTNLSKKVNRTLKTMIASFVGKHRQDWDWWLPEFQLAINTTVHIIIHDAERYTMLSGTGSGGAHTIQSLS